MKRSIALSLTLSLTLAAAVFGARPSDYSADLVVLEGGQVVQTMRLYVSGQKSRVEGFSAGPQGRIVTIARRDKGVTWTLYLDKKQYTEKALADGGQPGRPDLSNLDLGNLKKENLGRETILGYACTKMRVTMGKLPNGQAMTATAWVADSLDLPIRIETMGIVQENRNLKTGPQPASLFEIPGGFTQTKAPGLPAAMSPGASAAGGRVSGSAASTNFAQAAARYGGKQVAAPAAQAASSAPAVNAAWKLNTNYPGGDYKSIDMATSDPTACKGACDKEAQCKAWTLVRPESPGGMGYCWLKDSVPPEIAEDCCISGLKGASGSGTGPTAAAKSTASLWKLNTNLPGGDYKSIDMATSDPRNCKGACDKEAQCKSWTLVKPESPGGMGYCWLKDSVPPETREDCCISGVKR